jgi:hypothetical protein
MSFERNKNSYSSYRSNIIKHNFQTTTAYNQSLKPVTKNTPPQKEQVYDCPICSKRFSTIQQIEKHISSGRCAIALQNIQTPRNTKKRKSVTYEDDGFQKPSSDYYEDIRIISSANDHFTFGGEYASTSIAMEAAIHLLHETSPNDDCDTWGTEHIDEIVQTGCKLHPEKREMSFEEIYSCVPRFQKHLKVLASIKETTIVCALINV